ncbi:hypothetical protein Skr01_58440 [Sphaerisporangium krabiense]|uniref:Uncharacterized protein n=1 Tax=Sphaerisporangium krabiense TaxID=763782 RepID=A0A7W8Z8T7_9ACTN|nr:hypothetical protein [Sphaerisporangium krabiense]MBB5629390.1 hypothetical protein [Sphaerisporangium krabiense]GII65759.1 hypothetical protein Skr01_58440 [Sphaerisporangium krabiense]
MTLLGKISDRMLARVVPHVAAKAADCFTQTCGCQAGLIRYYWYRTCCWRGAAGGPYDCQPCYQTSITC